MYFKLYINVIVLRGCVAKELETPKEVLVQIENKRRSSVAMRRMSVMSAKSTNSQNARWLTELRQVQLSQHTCCIAI